MNRVRPEGILRQKIDNIQILRALAALAVVVFHTDFHLGSDISFGSFGVDIFFVISGFIMTMICANEDRSFFLKRLIRILPLYWLVTLAVFAMLRLHPGIDPQFARGPAELFKSLFFIPYMRADGIELPLLAVGWTLNYEICFYAAIAIGLRITKRRPMLAAVCLLSLLMLLMHLLPQNDITRFFGDSIILEFFMGIAAYRIYLALPDAWCSRLRPLCLALIPLCFAVMTWLQISGHTMNPRPFFLGIPAFLAVQSAVLLSKSGLDCSWGWLVLLGDASYSLYLTHLFVISAFKRIVSHHIPALAVTQVPGLLTVMAVSSLAAVLIHVALDKPTYRFLNRRLVPRGPR